MTDFNQPHHTQQNHKSSWHFPDAHKHNPPLPYSNQPVSPKIITSFPPSSLGLQLTSHLCTVRLLHVSQLTAYPTCGTPYYQQQSCVTQCLDNQTQTNPSPRRLHSTQLYSINCILYSFPSMILPISSGPNHHSKSYTCQCMPCILQFPMDQITKTRLGFLVHDQCNQLTAFLVCLFHLYLNINLFICTPWCTKIWS